jgi:hypothetical protein
MPAKRFGKTRYNRGHQKVRKMWAPRVRAGTVKCARWHQPILPGEKWDLDHDDTIRPAGATWVPLIAVVTERSSPGGADA